MEDLRIVARRRTLVGALLRPLVCEVLVGGSLVHDVPNLTKPAPARCDGRVRMFVAQPVPRRGESTVHDVEREHHLEREKDLVDVFHEVDGS